jgi:hypothetical protein
MSRVIPAVPGVPAAGHIAGGYWHPGPASTCHKGACAPPPAPEEREHVPRGPGCCRNPRAYATDPANHNRAVASRGRCPDPCHQPRRT